MFSRSSGCSLLGHAKITAFLLVSSTLGTRGRLVHSMIGNGRQKYQSESDVILFNDVMIRNTFVSVNVKNPEVAWLVTKRHKLLTRQLTLEEQKVPESVVSTRKAKKKEIRKR